MLSDKNSIYVDSKTHVSNSLNLNLPSKFSKKINFLKKNSEILVAEALLVSSLGDNFSERNCVVCSRLQKLHHSRAYFAVECF